MSSCSPSLARRKHRRVEGVLVRDAVIMLSRVIYLTILYHSLINYYLMYSLLDELSRLTHYRGKEQFFVPLAMGVCPEFPVLVPTT